MTGSSGEPARGETLHGEAAPSTFLMTDIEGSTRLWEEHPGAMGRALAVHDGLLRADIERFDGTVIKTTGDGMLAVFADPVRALDAAIGVQRSVGAASWGETGPLRVRIALHTGTAEARDGDYFGPALNRVARILAIAHGGQVICSAVTAILAADNLPPTVELLDLGSHRLRDIDRPEQIYQLAVDDLPRAFPPLRSLSTRRSNLPVALTSFVGREKELADVLALSARHRLVTLIGTGGTGKTRLMLEVAGRLVDDYPDGVWLAELAPLGDASQIMSEIARALGAPEVPGVPAAATVTAFLAEKRLLLLLDNAEHLVDGVAAIAERLLAGAPGLHVLATSREALAVAGEAVFQLPSLSCPAVAGGGAGMSASADELRVAAASEAVRLFTDRAAAVDPTFRLETGNAAPVAEICRRLDGIPLAIELAAARVSAMSPDEIATRLGDRFRLLTGGRRTAVPRQQTLHALIDWSWELLTPDDRRLLRRLSVFRGGWTVPFAARVVGDDGELDPVDLVDGLTRLVDRSLLVVDRGTTTRYRMLETIRQFAREKLVAADEAARVSDQHLAVFAGLALAAEDPLRGPAMVDWLDRLDPEVDNLWAALEWSLEADPWTAVRMASAMLGYWAVRVVSEDNDAHVVAAVQVARDRVANADAAPADLALAARLMGEAARVWAMAGRAGQAHPWAVEAMAAAERCGDRVARLAALGGLAISTVFSGHTDEGGANVRAMFEQAVALAEETGQWWTLAIAAGFSGTSIGVFDPQAGDALLDRGVVAAYRSGSPYAIAAVSIARGRTLGRLGRTDEAIAAFEAAIRGFIELGDQRFVLAARSDMAHALRQGGRLDAALDVYGETIGGWVHLGHKGAVASQLENIAYLETERGNGDVAVRLLGAADRLRTEAHALRAFNEEPEQTAYVERLRGSLGEAAFDARWRDGYGLAQADAVALATSRDTPRPAGASPLG